MRYCQGVTVVQTNKEDKHNYNKNPGKFHKCNLKIFSCQKYTGLFILQRNNIYNDKALGKKKCQSLVRF